MWGFIPLDGIQLLSFVGFERSACMNDGGRTAGCVMMPRITARLLCSDARSHSHDGAWSLRPDRIISFALIARRGPAAAAAGTSSMPRAPCKCITPAHARTPLRWPSCPAAAHRNCSIANRPNPPPPPFRPQPSSHPAVVPPLYGGGCLVHPSFVPCRPLGSVPVTPVLHAGCGVLI